MIPKIKKILYATDLSKNSAYAFYYAIDMAKTHDAKIIALHVIEPLPSFLITFEDFQDKVEQDRREEVNRKIEKQIQEERKKVDAQMATSSMELVSDILIRKGHPVEQILITADEEDCDVIILGSHGKGSLMQTFLGSVSSSVLHQSRKPVFIIPLPSGKVAIDSI